jgi:hypothetical protein
MGKEHPWYGEVVPWSEEQLEQYCRDMGFPQQTSKEDPLGTNTTSQVDPANITSTRTDFPLK